MSKLKRLPKRLYVYGTLLLLFITLYGFTPFSSQASSLIEYIQKNVEDVSTANGYVVLTINNLGEGSDRGTAIKGRNAKEGHGPGMAFGVFGETKGPYQSVGVNGWVNTPDDGNAVGVKGQADGTSQIGVLGVANGGGVPIYADNSSQLSGYGMIATQQSPHQGFGVGVSASQRAQYGEAVFAYAGGSAATAIKATAQGDNFGLWSENRIAVAGCVGCNAMTMIAINQGREALRPGDVVALEGVIPESDERKAPTISVIAASERNATQVVGIVEERIVFEKESSPNPLCHNYKVEPKPVPTPQASNNNLDYLQEQWEETQDYCRDNATIEDLVLRPSSGDIKSGNYMVIVTGGLGYVRVLEPVELGQQLIPSGTEGVAKVVDARIEPHSLQGRILGKVAGKVDSKTGLVPVIITLQ